ncbi:MBL fold metallo-hydrolase [Entomobacter blattae]|nr:MBL fold metallo-hydrolase [Entomobacter blattae]
MLQAQGMRLDVVPVTIARQNCSIFWEETTRTAVVIDPGGEVPHILEKIRQNDLKVEMILLTHGHFDHVGGAHDLREILSQKQREVVPVIGPAQADDFLLQGVEEQVKLFGAPDQNLKNVKVDRYLSGGEILEGAGRVFKVIIVTGHTPGHVAFFDEANKTLLAGDTLFAGTIGRTDFPYGNHDLLVREIKTKIFPLGDDIIVLPGHGRPTKIGIEKQSNPFLT